MSPILVAGPAVEPVTLAEAKAHLRLDAPDEDALIVSLTAAARQTLEHATRRAFIAQTWCARLDCWPAGRMVMLPLAPVLAVGAVRVRPASGPALALGPALYSVISGADPEHLVVGADAPQPGIARGGIEIEASYGFGAAPADVPGPIRLAIHRLVAFWFERRGDEAGADRGLPGDVQALVAPFIRPRIA